MAFTDATETVVTYNLNGSQREFNIPFDYLSRSFVQVSVFGENTDKRLVVGDDYNYLDSRTISTVRALGGSDGWKRLQIRRYTSDDRIVDFKDGSVLKSADLNVAVVQALHIAAEGRDGKFDLMGVNSEGNWDAIDRKINRLAPGTERRDAVNLGQVLDWSNSALNQADRAKREADNAARSAAAAKVSETNSKTSETNAKSSESAAKSSASSASASMTEAAKSQVAAKTSETNAKTSEVNANASETASKSEADRSYSEAERAKGYADSMGNTIDIGKVIYEIDTQTNKVTWKGTQQAAGNFVTTGLNYQIRPVGATFNGLAVEMGVNVGSGTPHYAWKKTGTAPWTIIYYPSENGMFATREWVNKMVYTPNDAVTRVQSPNGRYTVQLEDRGIWGFKDTVSDSYRMAFDAEGIATFYGASLTIRGPNHYTGINLYRSDSSRIRLEVKPDTQIHCLEIPMYNASGTHLRTLGLPNSAGTVATREWVKENSQLGEEWMYYKSGGEDMDKVWNLMDAIARTPKNAVFTRLERDNQWTCRFYCRTLRYAN